MSGVLWWSIVLIAVVVAAFVLVAQVKRRLVKPDDSLSAGFTLSDLRALHRSGKMSDAEFERAKGAVVAAAKRAEERAATQKKAIDQPAAPEPQRPDRPARH